MAINFVLQVAFMTVVTTLGPRKAPVRLPDRGRIDTRPMPRSGAWGGAVIASTLVLYVVFW